MFTINPCNVKANNVIVGSTWVDNEGAYALINTTTGARADMYFTPCGWWGNGRYQVDTLFPTIGGVYLLSRRLDLPMSMTLANIWC